MTFGAKPRRVIFHIGLAKTGTTAFQQFCHRQRGYLKRHGVLYPRGQMGRAHNHSPLVASYIPHRPEGPTVAVRWTPRVKAVRSLCAEIDANASETVLISSEHFSMHFDRSEALELAADFGAYDCTIVIVLRDTHARFLSAYNTHVTAGGCLPIEDYARSVLIPGTRYMSARQTVLIWQEAFGRERVRIVDYDATEDVAGSILGICGIDTPLPPAARDRTRVSLDRDTIEVLRDANAIIAARQAVPADRSLAAWAQLSLFSILCRRKLTRFAQGDGRAPWTISAETMQALDEIAAADTRWVAETYGIPLRGDQIRKRIEVAAPRLANTTHRAEALVDRVARGLWTPSQAMVALWGRFARNRP